MQEPYNEGLTNHIDPESCGYVGNDMSEALTGGHAGRVSSRESLYIIAQSADAVENVGRQHWVCCHREACPGSARSETPCTYVNSLRRNWEIPYLATCLISHEVRTANPEGVTQ